MMVQPYCVRFTGQGTVQYPFDNVVSYVVSKTKDDGVYLMIDTKIGMNTTS